MKKLKSFLAVLLCVAISMMLFSCSQGDAQKQIKTSSSNTVSEKASGTSSDNSSDENESQDAVESAENIKRMETKSNNYDFLFDDLDNETASTNAEKTELTAWREPYVNITTEFVDKDGEFKYQTTDWSGPDGYVVVYPEKSSVGKKCADSLLKYYQSKGIKLNSMSDNNSEVSKEILIGKTNRKQSQGKINEKECKSYIDGDKLVLIGGHEVTTQSAVDKFIRLSPEKNKAITFSITTDFTSSTLDGYKYVWGDEFEGTDIDYTKWSYELAMTGSGKVEVSYDKNVINVNDGRLKLHALRFFNPDRAGTEYRVPYSVSTADNMNFTYGYAEIRARLPMFSGVWPSFWTRSTDKLKGTRTKDFMAEVDIFEIFGSPKVTPGIIKWYADGTHSFYVSNKDVKSHLFADAQKSMTEYHTYGWEWTPKEMSMYVDGIKYMTFDIVNSFDKNNKMNGFHDTEYVMFNNHLIAKDTWQKGPVIENSHNLLPACYYIDYFRLYQKPGVGELYTSDTSHEYPDRK